MKGKKGKDAKPVPPPARPAVPENVPVVTSVEASMQEEEKEGLFEFVTSENQFLKAKLEEMTRRLAEAEEVNQELSQAKTMLSDEIVDLTKVLFEEANGMVANEVKARTQLETTRRKLQSELENTKDRLRLESQQLADLKQKLYEISLVNSNVSLNTCLMGAGQNESRTSFSSNLDALTRSGSYFDLLFPDRRFNSKLKCNGQNAVLWDEIVRSLDMNTFQSFSRFLEIIGKLDDEGVLGNPFAKRIYENDVIPCLSFDSKPKTFVKKLVLSMFKNTCAIEQISASSPLPSPLQETAAPPIVASPRQIDLDSPVVPSCPETSTINSMMSELALSFSALPDVFILDSTYKLTAVPKTPNRFCSLCGACIPVDFSQPLYKFKQSEKDPVMLVDGACRNKLVAAAEFYTFLRHLKRGIFANRPIIDLYYELLHYLRNMFYARTGSCSFFIQSDLEILSLQHQ